MSIQITIASPHEYAEIGQLMVEVYSSLAGFPSKEEQPDYYTMLANIGDFAKKKSVELLAGKESDELLGAVVYIGDMSDYGSGGTATKEKNTAGFRLLAVSQKARGKGVGKKLTDACIEKAREQNRDQVVIHTTEAMKVAWSMYERMGFQRSEDLDFLQAGFPVFGFRLRF